QRRSVARPHAATDYMEALETGDGCFDTPASLVKSLASLLVVVTGSAIGREGAMILLAALAASLSRPFVLERFCEQEGGSERALRQQFRQQTGMTINHYLRQLRICHAQYLLQHTERLIGDIAMQCGFEDSNYFSVVFSREIGMSPGQWRQRSRAAA
ncbi:helix-turn-helix domain-containing protein, partial [Escherichia coli]|nr:helix-turn-helix domain-containing protein [Escherichia coli]